MAVGAIVLIGLGVVQARIGEASRPARDVAAATTSTAAPLARSSLRAGAHGIVSPGGVETVPVTVAMQPSTPLGIDPARATEHIAEAAATSSRATHPRSAPARRAVVETVAPPRAAQTAAVALVTTPPSRSSADTRAAQSLSDRAFTAYVRGRFDVAQSLYARATHVDPMYATAWRGLGLSYAALGRSAEARQALERYLALAQSAPDAALVRARLRALGAV